MFAQHNLFFILSVHLTPFIKQESKGSAATESFGPLEQKLLQSQTAFKTTILIVF